MNLFTSLSAGCFPKPNLLYCISNKPYIDHGQIGGSY